MSGVSEVRGWGTKPEGSDDWRRRGQKGSRDEPFVCFARSMSRYVEREKNKGYSTVSILLFELLQYNSNIQSAHIIDIQYDREIIAFEWHISIHQKFVKTT
jgi:hypothetical protein